MVPFAGVTVGHSWIYHRPYDLWPLPTKRGWVAYLRKARCAGTPPPPPTAALPERAPAPAHPASIPEDLSCIGVRDCLVLTLLPTLSKGARRDFVKICPTALRVTLAIFYSSSGVENVSYTSPIAEIISSTSSPDVLKKSTPHFALNWYFMFLSLLKNGILSLIQ
jgi:hypothetical protein